MQIVHLLRCAQLETIRHAATSRDRFPPGEPATESVTWNVVDLGVGQKKVRSYIYGRAA